LRSKHRGFSEDDDPAFAESQGNPLCTPGGRNLFPGFAVNIERRVGQPQKSALPGGPLRDCPVNAVTLLILSVAFPLL
jgi:hypothetical protein